MTTPDLAAAPAPLGPFAQAVESNPIATLTATGAVIGIGVGTVLGMTASVAVGGSMAGWIAKCGGVWGAAFGVLGYLEGRALSEWMQANSSPPPSPIP
jgi:hypothetical protein